MKGFFKWAFSPTAPDWVPITTVILIGTSVFAAVIVSFYFAEIYNSVIPLFSVPGFFAWLVWRAYQGREK